MKKVFFVFVVMSALVLTACGASAEPTAIPTVSLNGNAAATARPSSSDSVSASAVIVPLNETQLSFTSIGRVTAVNVKVGDKVKAGDVLVTLDTAFLEAKVREAEASLLTTEIQLKYLKRVGTGQKHLELAEADVQRAQALVDSAKAALLAQSGLAAPFDGTIVSVDVAVSETVSPGRVVIILGDLSGYKIETTDLSERNIPKVKLGQSANVFIDALNDTYAGQVIAIDNISSTLGGDVVYKVTIQLDEQPQGLLWGMSADVQIILGQ
ncbi:MAG: efflux RND transporter periplasmic adaptor subunit [Anaerolineales bacterium]|nr:efflux RND transporter periplasmic adaptor subunit [Anaerolineales bacterium]